MEELDRTETARPPRVRRRLVTGGAVCVALMTLGAAALAADGGDPPGEHPEIVAALEPGGDDAAAPAPLRGLRGGRKLGHGMMGALHGEFVTRAPESGFQTMAMQRGEVTEVSSSSITVKSEDGFTRTYVVNEDTIVQAGDDGIADVATGDTVHVVAVVEDDRARAVRIADATKLRESHRKWAPRRDRMRRDPEPAA